VPEDLLDDEYVLRAVHEDYFDPESGLGVSRQAFVPRKNDLDGISVYRRSDCTPEELAASLEQRNYIFAIRVEAVRALGLSVIPDESEPGLGGHCLIPQLSFGAMKEDRKLVRNLTYKLALLLDSASLVYSPPEEMEQR
jgi:hypothetical protein